MTLIDRAKAYAARVAEIEWFKEYWLFIVVGVISLLIAAVVLAPWLL